jgi:hypothetical protein
MFLLSRPATRSKGRDRDHPVVLEGYKKDEFTCLLKVMYPTYVHVIFTCIDPFYLWTFDTRARSLIPGGTLELQLKKEEWVSVLKLSTIWNMTKVCRMQSVTQAGPTDTRYLLTRSGSARFTGCRLMQR